MVVVIGVSFWLRKQDYAIIPIPGQSVDEYSYSWVGMSLIEAGMPVGISGLSGYRVAEKKYINVDRIYQQVLMGDPLTINYPWMDHPPLLGLITGGYAYIAGARVFEETTALLIRRPIIIIGTMSVMLVMILGWQNFGFGAGIMAGLIYGTTPLVVLSSRMIQAENAIIPCFLLVLITIGQYCRDGKDRWLILTGVVSGVATLFKLSGIVCYLVSVLILLNKYRRINKRLWQDIGLLVAVGAPISGLFVVYGITYDWETYQEILLSNYGRFYGVGPSLFLELIRNQRLTQHKFLPEVWIIIGWIALVAIKNKLLTLAIVAYLVVYVLFGSQPYGWYAFPFWPILALVVTRLLWEKRDSWVVWWLSLIILGENLSRVIGGIDEFQRYSGWWRWGVVGTLIAVTMLWILKIKIKWRMGLALMWAVNIVLNILYLKGMTIDFWWQNIS